MAITIESLRAGDREARHDLGRQAFGATRPFDADRPAFPEDRDVAAYDGDRLVGAAATHGFGMHWGGRSVPCGGVAGVVVAPEVRGQDVARRMLAESFDRMAARGEVLSGLFPTTASLYRSMGYEIAGWWRRSVFGLGDIRADDDDDVVWRRVAIDDPAIATTYAAMAPVHDGWLDLPEVWWRLQAHQRADPSVNRFAYVGGRGGRDEVSLIFRYESSEDTLYDLEIEHVGSTTGAAGVGAALAFLTRHGTTAGRVGTTLPPDVLAPHLPHLQRLRTARQWAWMTRLVDVAGVVASRGWPPGVRASVAFDVVDPQRHANAGPGVLVVDDGEARWEPGGAGTVTVHVTALAALLAGCDPRRLAEAGSLDGATAGDLGALGAACHASPTAIDFF